MNKKNIFWGIILILVAVYLVTSKMGFLPEIDFITIVLAILVVAGICKRSFALTLIPLAGIACVYDTELGIEAITPGTLLIAAVLVSIGLRKLFPKKEQVNHYGANPSPSNIQNFADGNSFRVSNSFNSVSKYVNSDCFSRGQVENSFGSCNVYFTNAVLDHARAVVDVKNSFGEVNLYFPRTWRVDVQRTESFGRVKFEGMGSQEPNAPTITLVASTSFGEINVYYN